MNSTHASESAVINEFCPICQVPTKSLKILFSIHVSMCDVQWNELEECINGENCADESVFHYRDFSHQVLATHRENLRKRKLEECENCGPETSSDKLEKENLAKRAPRRKSSKSVSYRVEADDEENVFVNHPKKTQKLSTVRKRTSKKSSNNLTNSVTEDALQSICKEVTEESSFSQKLNSSETTITNDAEISSFSAETSLEKKNDDTGIDDVLCQSLEDTSNSTFLNQDENFNFDDWEEVEEMCNTNAVKKEKCKAEWNQIFGNKKDSGQKSEPSAKKKFFGSAPKEAKACPHYKIMPGTGFAVDAFQFGSLPGVTTYFLSHFHSDHYIGLKKSFSHPLYCSLITANLVKKKIRVQEKYIHILEINNPIVLNRVEITCFDANHCPGALMILFRLTNGEQYLHVGDFRASILMEDEPELRRSCITRLYLDTTYFNPHYVFPTQTEVIDRVKKIVQEKHVKHTKALFVTGTYLIGKEKVFLGILELLKCKLWALPPKRDVFRCLENETILSALTTKSTEAKIHVLPMNHLRFDRLQKHLLDQSGAFSHIIAFKPTGWEMGRKSGHDWINPSSNGNITIYGVPYSEHSNFEELCRFINFIKADKVIPTVPMSNRDMYRFLKKIVDSYKGPLKQQNIDQFLIK